MAHESLQPFLRRQQMPLAAPAIHRIGMMQPPGGVNQLAPGPRPQRRPLDGLQLYLALLQQQQMP